MSYSRRADRRNTHPAEIKAAEVANLRGIAADFRESLGDERYEQFVAALTGVCIEKGRLMHWQEAVWSEFCERRGLRYSNNLYELYSTFDLDTQILTSGLARRAVADVVSWAKKILAPSAALLAIGLIFTLLFDHPGFIGAMAFLVAVAIFGPLVSRLFR